VHTRTEPRQFTSEAAGDTVTHHGDSPALRLWATVSSELAAKPRPLSGVLVKEVLREIQDNVPAYTPN